MVRTKSPAPTGRAPPEKVARVTGIQTAKRRFRPGTVAKREVRTQQRQTGLVTAVQPYQRLIDDILQDLADDGNRLSITPGARHALQVFGESHMVGVMRATRALATHSGRVTIYKRDMRMVYDILRIMGKGDRSSPYSTLEKNGLYCVTSDQLATDAAAKKTAAAKVIAASLTPVAAAAPKRKKAKVAKRAPAAKKKAAKPAKPAKRARTPPAKRARATAKEAPVAPPPKKRRVQATPPATPTALAFSESGEDDEEEEDDVMGEEEASEDIMSSSEEEEEDEEEATGLPPSSVLDSLFQTIGMGSTQTATAKRAKKHSTLFPAESDLEEDSDDRSVLSTTLA